MTELPNIIAVDFDGTCVTHEYPKIGRNIGAVSVLKELAARGCKLILWTMRSDDGPHGPMLTEAVNWFQENGIPLFGIQSNPEQAAWTSSPKAYAKLYIDDAALGAPLCPGLHGERPFIDWCRVRELLLPDTVEPTPCGVPTEPGEYLFKGSCISEYFTSDFFNWTRARVFFNKDSGRLNVEFTRDNGATSRDALAYCDGEWALPTSTP